MIKEKLHFFFSPINNLEPLTIAKTCKKGILYLAKCVNTPFPPATTLNQQTALKVSAEKMMITGVPT